MNRRCAIETDLFVEQHHKQTLGKLGDPPTEIEAYIDFGALAAQASGPYCAAPCQSLRWPRPPYPTETMVRILFLKRLYHLSDEQMQYQLL